MAVIGVKNALVLQADVRFRSSTQPTSVPPYVGSLRFFQPFLCL
jgi:hypothetical protein